MSTANVLSSTSTIEQAISDASHSEQLRYAASQRAMNEALAEQEELITQSEANMWLCRSAISSLEQKQSETDQSLHQAVQDKDTTAISTLTKLRHVLVADIADKRAEEETSQLETTARKAQLSQMQVERKLAAADETERVLQIKIRTTSLQQEKERAEKTSLEQLVEEKKTVLLETQEDELYAAEVEFRTAVAAKDAFAQKRIDRRRTRIKEEIAETKIVLEKNREAAKVRRNIMKLRVDERDKRDEEESERLRIAAARRASVHSEEEQREYILKHERKRIKWEAEIVKLEEDERSQIVALSLATEQKDHAAEEKARALHVIATQKASERRTAVAEARSALRERRELLEYEERERRQRVEEDVLRRQAIVERRVAESKADERRETEEKNRQREAKITYEQIRLERETVELEKKIKEAIDAKDEATTVRLQKSAQIAKEKLKLKKEEKQKTNKEVAERREINKKEEQQKSKAESKEKERQRVVQKRRAAAKKEEEQIHKIMNNRKKDETSQARIKSVEEEKGKKEDEWRGQRRRRSILGSDRVKSQREEMFQEAQTKKLEKENKSDNVKERKEKLELAQKQKQETIATKIKEKEQATKERLCELKNKNGTNLTAAATVVPNAIEFDTNTAAIKIQSTSRMKKEQRHLSDKKKAVLKIQTQARGKIGRSRSTKIKETKTTAAIQIQKIHRGKGGRKKSKSKKKKKLTRLELKEQSNGIVLASEKNQDHDSDYELDELKGAASKIQKIQRGRTSRKATYARKQKKRNQVQAVIKVQALQRGAIARNTADERKTSIVRIQATSRGHDLRKKIKMTQKANPVRVLSVGIDGMPKTQPTRPNGDSPQKKNGVSRGGRVEALA